MTGIIITIVSLLLAFCDQFTKYLAVKYLEGGEAKHILSVGETDILTFSFYKNSGAAFSSFQGQTVILSVITIVLIIALIVYIYKTKTTKLFPVICTAMIVGGGIGNLIDRIRLKYVVDFIILFPFKFIFNFADICVVIGAILLAAYYIFSDKKAEGKNG